MATGQAAGLCRVLLVAVTVGSGQVSQLAAQRNPDAFIFSECPVLADRMEAPGSLGSLLNPVIDSRAALDDEIVERQAMLDCMESVRTRTVLPDWFATVRSHLELFLSITEPPPGAEQSALQLIDLETVDDPAVRTLREEVGLRPPEGAIFIRFFPDRNAMPENVRRAFENPDTQAVTMSSRYVAVLAASAPASSPAVQRALTTTLSHELVHAYLNSGLDWQDPAERFPSWFHEGMAIHFSGSGQAHVSLDPAGGLIRFAPTSEYEQYERVFRYLETHLGKARFYRSIRQAVVDVDTAGLLSEAGAANYEQLLAAAERWWRWWPVPGVLVEGRRVWVSAGAVLLLLVGILWRWRRWEPAVPGSSLEVNLNRDLIAAVRNGDTDEVGDLLSSGANPNARDGEGYSALEWAIWAGRVAIVELLVDRGARVTADIRQATLRRDDPDMERVIADATSRQREVW